VRCIETTRPRSLSKISRSCFGLRPPRSSGPTQRWPSSICREPKSRMYITISPVVQSARSYGERLAFLHDDRLRHSLPRVSAKKGQHVHHTRFPAYPCQFLFSSQFLGLILPV